MSDTPRTGEWWCPECKEALPWNRVTYRERCDTCGTHVHVSGEGEVARLERELANMTAARDRTLALLNGAIEENTKLRTTVSANSFTREDAAKLCEQMADQRVDGQEYSDVQAAVWGAHMKMAKHLRSLPAVSTSGTSVADYMRGVQDGIKASADYCRETLAANHPGVLGNAYLHAATNIEAFASLRVVADGGFVSAIGKLPK